MKAITPRQKDVLCFIAQFIEDNMFSPTVREIAEHFSISLRAVQDHIGALQKKGYITPNLKRARSMRVLHDLREAGGTPFLARIPLLKPVLTEKTPSAEENIEKFVSYAAPFIQQGEDYFAVSVKDAGMSGIGIMEGDTAIVRSVEELGQVSDGTIVAAVNDGGLVVIRRLFREASRVCLQPENQNFPPAYFQDIRLIGELSGIIRGY